MRTFKYKQERFNELRKKILTRTMPIILVAMASGIYISFQNTQSNGMSSDVLPISIPISILVVLLAGGTGLFRGIKRRQALYNSFLLLLDQDGITREQSNTATIKIMNSDITLIAKNANRSFTIRGKSSRDVIVVEDTIQEYEELERMLRQVKPFSESVPIHFLERYGRVFIIFTLVLFFAVFISDDKTIVTVGGILIIGLMGWSTSEALRSKNIDAKTKRSIYLVVFPIFSILAKLVILWL